MSQIKCMALSPVQSKTDQIKKQVSEFFTKMAPEGAYFRYTQALLAVLALTFLTLLTLLLLPYITGSKYQNFVGKLTGYKFGGSGGKPTPSPTASPRPIPHGKIGFTVGQSDKTVPQFARGFIDPYDPAKGGTQTVTIAVKHTQPVIGVTAVLKTDNNISEPHPFKLISGSDTDGQWQGSWKVTDTYLYTYALVLNAESSDSSASVEVILR